MYRAVLLCALVLLVASPSLTSAQGLNRRLHGASAAVESAALLRTDNLGASLGDKASSATLAQAISSSPKPAEIVAADVKTPASDSVKGVSSGDAATSAPAAAAPKDAAAQQPGASSPAAAAQQPEEQQKKLDAPAAKQPEASQPTDAQQQTAAAASTDGTTAAAEPTYTEPGVNRELYWSGVEYHHTPSSSYTNSKPYTGSGEYLPYSSNHKVYSDLNGKPYKPAYTTNPPADWYPSPSANPGHYNYNPSYPKPSTHTPYNPSNPSPYNPSTPSPYNPKQPGSPYNGEHTDIGYIGQPGSRDSYDSENDSKHDSKDNKHEEEEEEDEWSPKPDKKHNKKKEKQDKQDKKHKEEHDHDDDSNKEDKHDKHMHHTGKAAKKLAKAKNGEKYLSDDDDDDSSQYKKAGTKDATSAQPQAEQPEQASSQSLVDPMQAGAEGTSSSYPMPNYVNNKPYVDGPGAYPPGAWPGYSTYEAETPGYDPEDKSDKKDKKDKKDKNNKDKDESDQHMHHTGKAAKKMFKAQNGEKYLGDDAGYKVTAQVVNPMSDKEREKVQKLQKYYEAEAELLAAELEEGDDSISTFARPSKYSNKAAKYAAMALKAQGAKKIPVLQTQLQVQTAPTMTVVLPGQQAAAQTQGAQADAKPSLANFAANLLKKKPAADKAATLSVPKPTIKGQKGDSAVQANPEAAAEDEVSWEDYMANPQLYAGMPATGNQPVIILAHEQYQKPGKKAHGKKGEQNVRVMNGVKRPAYSAVDGKAYYDPYDLDGYDSKDKGYDKAYDPYWGYHMDDDSWEKDEPFSMDKNYHPPMRRKEMKNVYNFRALPNSESTTVGLTRATTGAQLTAADSSTPVVLVYNADMTCGPQPGVAGSIGNCRATGIGRDQDNGPVMMTFTCTIRDDASNMCGLKYVQGMQITAQGNVNVSYRRNAAGGSLTVTRLEGDVIPITGVYVPGRRTTLLADVVTLLSGVKGGSLMFTSKGDSDGHFSFYFWR